MIDHNILCCDLVENGRVVKICFTGSGHFSPVRFSDSLKAHLESTASVDELVLLADEKSVAEIVSSWENERGSLPARFASTGFYLLSFRHSLAETTYRKRFNRDVDLHIAFDFERLLTTQLLEDCNPLELAPKGAYFSKSEGRKSSFFVRAARVAKFEVAQYFIACLALKNLVAQSSLIRIKTIHVDTNAITGIAVALANLHARYTGQADSSASIRSFESYGGETDFRWGAGTDEVVLVSASSSASLPNRLVTSRGVPRNSVFTVVGDRQRHLDIGVKVLIDSNDIPQYQNSIRRDKGKMMRGLAIVVRDEDFNFHATEPRGVLLTLPSHEPIRWKAGKDAVSLQLHKQIEPLLAASEFLVPPGESSASPSMRRPISVNAAALVRSERFRVRLREFVDKHASAIGETLIVISDEQADAVSELKQFMLGLSNPKLRFESHLKLDDPSVPEPDCISRVLVVAPTIASGWVLEDAAKRLRERGFARHDRAYFIGAWLTPTLRRADILARNISQSEHGAFHIESLARLPVGYRLNAKTQTSIWLNELEILEKLATQNAVYSPRVDQLRTPTPDSVCWSPEREGEPLSLSQSFAFWRGQIGPGGFNSTVTTQVDVLLTIASVLQSAREFPIASVEFETDSLMQQPYERRFLSSENFFRYNDPLIQGVLLRAAEDFELDYSDSPEESQSISEYIISMLSAAKSLRRQALYEFLLAIRINRLRLHNDAETKVRKALSESSADNDWAKLLLLNS